MSEKKELTTYEKIEEIIAEMKNFSPDNFNISFGEKKDDETFIDDTNGFEKALLLAGHKLMQLQFELLEDECNLDYSDYEFNEIENARNGLDTMFWSSVRLRIGNVKFGVLLRRENAKIVGIRPTP